MSTRRLRSHRTREPSPDSDSQSKEVPASKAGNNTNPEENNLVSRIGSVAEPSARQHDANSQQAIDPSPEEEKNVDMETILASARLVRMNAKDSALPQFDALISAFQNQENLAQNELSSLAGDSSAFREHGSAEKNIIRSKVAFLEYLSDLVQCMEGDDFELMVTWIYLAVSQAQDFRGVGREHEP
jgi:hypothetical protein